MGNHLDARWLADDTIVIYQADHGHSTETRAFGGRLPEDFFLADLDADPGERSNLADRHPEIRDRLLRLCDELAGDFASQ